MPARLIALGLSLALAACAAAPLPAVPPAASASRADAAPPQRGEAITGEAGRDLARRLLATLADDVVEVRRAWSGPGYYLHGFQLWERAVAAPHPNICAVRIHRLNLTDLTPQARHDPDATLNASARVESVSSEVRFRAVGPVINSEAPAPGHQAACAALGPDSGFFRADSEPEAYTALQAFEMTQRAVRDPNTRMITVECTSFDQPCADGRAALAALGTQQITNVRRTPCADAAQTECWTFDLQAGQAAPWTLQILSLRRPMRVVLRQVQPPVV